MTKNTRKIAVLAHSSATNSLGRALSMALVAQNIADVAVFAIDDGPVWKGAAQFPFAVYKDKPSAISIAVAKWNTTNEELIAWVSKGIAPLPSITREILAGNEHCRVILDIDDHDVELARSFRSDSLKNRLILNIGRRMHPYWIKRAQKWFSDESDAFTFSTNALANSFGQTESEFSARIPHVRQKTSNDIHGRSRTVSTETPIQIGLLGTIRAHKGGDLVLALLSGSSDYQLTVFESSGLAFDRSLVDQITELPADTPLHHAYAGVDVAVVVMDTQKKGARLQFPAKMIDAFRAGVPVIASDTEAIREVAEDCAVIVPEPADTERIKNAIDLAIKNDCGPRGRARFEQVFTPEAASDVLLELLGRLEARSEVRS